MHHGVVTDVLARFSAPTREWFTGAFEAPTPAQLGAWDAISSGVAGNIATSDVSVRVLATALTPL